MPEKVLILEKGHPLYRYDLKQLPYKYFSMYYI